MAYKFFLGVGVWYNGIFISRRDCKTFISFSTKIMQQLLNSFLKWNFSKEAYTIEYEKRVFRTHVGKNHFWRALRGHERVPPSEGGVGPEL